MKTIVNILLIVVVLSACNKSPEQKAEVLIKDSLKKLFINQKHINLLIQK